MLSSFAPGRSSPGTDRGRSVQVASRSTERVLMPTRTFANPVPGVILGDPFVLRWRGRFYLYGTNDGPPLPDGRQIPVHVSDDLIHWEPMGGALIPSEPAADHWAPEVLA